MKQPAVDILFWGATGQAKVLREALNPNFRLVALIDKRILESPWPDIPLFGGLDELLSWFTGKGSAPVLKSAVAVGGDKGRDRLMLMDLLEGKGIHPITVIHRRAFVARDSRIGSGCQILANSAVCSHAHLGRGVIVNTSASVDHDCILADGVHIGPGANLAGEVEIGACAFVGTGATILPRVKVGAYAIVGAGSVVIRDVPAGSRVVGVPARQLDV